MVQQQFRLLKEKILALATGEFDLDEHDHKEGTEYSSELNAVEEDLPTASNPRDVLKELFQLRSKNRWRLERKDQSGEE